MPGFREVLTPADVWPVRLGFFVITPPGCSNSLINLALFSLSEATDSIIGGTQSSRSTTLSLPSLTLSVTSSSDTMKSAIGACQLDFVCETEAGVFNFWMTASKHHSPHHLFPATDENHGSLHQTIIVPKNTSEIQNKILKSFTSLIIQQYKKIFIQDWKHTKNFVNQIVHDSQDPPDLSLNYTFCSCTEHYVINFQFGDHQCTWNFQWNNVLVK